MPVKSQKVLAAFGAWMIAVLALLVLFNRLSYENVFMLDFIGLLLIVQMSGPHNMNPKWRSRLNVFLIAGAAAFALLIFNRAMSILSLKLA